MPCSLYVMLSTFIAIKRPDLKMDFYFLYCLDSQFGVGKVTKKKNLKQRSPPPAPHISTMP